jgi:hypothetical protein
LRYNPSISPEALRKVFVRVEIRIWPFLKINQNGYNFSQIVRFTVLRTDTYPWGYSVLMVAATIKLGTGH